MHFSCPWFRACSVRVTKCDHVCQQNLPIQHKWFGRFGSVEEVGDDWVWGSISLGVRPEKTLTFHAHQPKTIIRRLLVQNLEKPSLCSFRALTTDLSHSVVDRISSHDTSGTGSCQWLSKQQPLHFAHLCPMDCLPENSSYINLGWGLEDYYVLEQPYRMLNVLLALAISSCSEHRAAWKDSSNGLSSSGVSPWGSRHWSSLLVGAQNGVSRPNPLIYSAWTRTSQRTWALNVLSLKGLMYPVSQSSPCFRNISKHTIACHSPWLLHPLAPAIVPVVAMFFGAKGQLPRCALPLNQEATLTAQINAVLIAANKATSPHKDQWAVPRSQSSQGSS